MSIFFFAVEFMGLRCVFPFSVQAKMGLSVGRDHPIFSLSLPISAHLSTISFDGSPRWAFILMKMVSNPWSIRSRRSCMIALIVSACGCPHMEGNLPSPDHFREEKRRQAETDIRTIVFLSFLFFSFSSARHAAPSSSRLEEFPSSPLPSW